MGKYKQVKGQQWMGSLAADQEKGGYNEKYSPRKAFSQSVDVKRVSAFVLHQSRFAATAAGSTLTHFCPADCLVVRAQPIPEGKRKANLLFSAVSPLHISLQMFPLVSITFKQYDPITFLLWMNLFLTGRRAGRNGLKQLWRCLWEEDDLRHAQALSRLFVLKDAN